MSARSPEPIHAVMTSPVSRDIVDTMKSRSVGAPMIEALWHPNSAQTLSSCVAVVPSRYPNSMRWPKRVRITFSQLIDGLSMEMR